MSFSATEPESKRQKEATGNRIRVAVIGQPNSGKSSIFNRLTGLRQRVGNYPGVTVEKHDGFAMCDGRPFVFTDLPGTYSLNAISPDEQLAVNALGGRMENDSGPDMILCVADATRLERSLAPAVQAAALELPMVIALNFADEAERMGMRIDTELLSARLGVPVVLTNAKNGTGINTLRSALCDSLQTGLRLSSPDWPEAVTRAIALLEPHASSGQKPRGFLAQRLLFDTSGHAVAAIGGSVENPEELLERARAELRKGGHHHATAEPVLIFAHLQKLLEGVVTGSVNRRGGLSDALDRVFAQPLLGLVFFGLVMFGVFQAVYSWAGPLMDLIDAGFGALGDLVGGSLEGTPMLQSLVVDGIIGGIGSAVIFLPQILILTFLIALLEDTGYLARAAFLIDRAFGWCGLNGKSFVPLMSSYACAIPGIMAARTIEDTRTRLTTIFIAPLMSCSARLPVYVIMISAFIEPRFGATGAALTLFAMHMLGPILALPIAWVMQKRVLKSPQTPFLLELPPYRFPAFTDLFYRLWQRTLRFLTDAGTVIFFMTIIIWALLYFPRPTEVGERAKSEFIARGAAEAGVEPSVFAARLEEDSEGELAGGLEASLGAAYIEQSYLGRAGKAIQPLFEPAGFDWKITVAVLASFPAREVVIATLGIIYNLGDDQDEESDSLRDRLREARWVGGAKDGEPVFSIATAVSLMIFFALCMQCGATVAIIKSESGWKWAVASMLFMTVLAWIGAVLAYQILSRVLPG